VTTTNSTPHEVHDLLDPGRWSTDYSNPNTQIGALVIGVVCLLMTWIVARMVSLAVHRFLDKAERAGADPTGIRFLGKLASLAVYVFGFTVYSHLIPALQRLGTAWLTSMGLVSVVVGLAAQSTLGNLISGVSLVLYRPFKLGDRLEVTGPKGVEVGAVDSINLGNTILRTDSNRLMVIPNSLMANQVCVNLSQLQKSTTVTVVFTLPIDADVPAARKILLALAQGHPKTASVSGCYVTALTGSSTELTLNLAISDGSLAAQVKSDLFESARTQFAAAGIKLA
jgi:small-conductance mechanosensitive channel